MNPTAETSIRVPVSLRDRIKTEASRLGLKQADLLGLALRELQQAEFLRAVAAVELDSAATVEATQWDEADLAGTLDPWDPGT
jgi:hypothetical protein